jgi:hypothetical protein
VFLLVEVQKYYKLRDPEEHLNTDFMVKFYEHHDTSRVMASWWREDKKFTNRSTGWYGTTNLRDPYIYLMALICRLYKEKYCSRFSEAWMPLAYTVVIIGCNFNWGEIISKQLSICMQQAQTEGRRDTIFLHGLVPARCHLHKEHFHWHESELACLRAPDPHLLQRAMGEHVQEILRTYLR